MRFQLLTVFQSHPSTPCLLQGSVFPAEFLLLPAFNSNQSIIILDMHNKWKTFILTFLTYSLIHSVRTSWSSLKFILNSAPYNFSVVFLGTLDMIVLLVLAISLNLFGPKIEQYGPKKFLMRGMIGLCIILLLLSILLFGKVSVNWPYAIIYSLVGIFSCVGWPACLFILSQYFQKGIVFSFWNGCSQFGDFIALITSYIIIQVIEINSGVFLFIMACFLAVSCFLDRSYLHQIQQFQQDPNAANNPGYDDKPIDELVEEKEKYIEAPQGSENMITQLGVTGEYVPTINFITVWTLPGVAAYILSFLFVKSVNAVIVTWLVFYLSLVGMVSESRIIGLLWAISTFLGGLLGSLLNPTFDKKIFIGALFASSILFIFLQEIHLYPNDAEMIILVIACGLIFGGPFTLMNTSISIFLSQKPVIRNIPGAKAAIISAMEGYGFLFSGISLLIIPVVGVIDLHWIACIYCAIAAIILLFQEIREDKHEQNSQIKINYFQREGIQNKKGQNESSVKKKNARLIRRTQIIKQKLSKTFSNFNDRKQIQLKPQKVIKQDNDTPYLQEEFKDFQHIQINIASPAPDLELRSKGLRTSQRSENQDDQMPSTKPLITECKSSQMLSSEPLYSSRKKNEHVLAKFSGLSKSNHNAHQVQGEKQQNNIFHTTIQ